MTKFDSVTKPQHYADKEIEVIDYIRDTLTTEEFIGYCVGNVIKYVSRWRSKGGEEDLKKAQTYINWASEIAESEAFGKTMIENHRRIMEVRCDAAKGCKRAMEAYMMKKKL